ncbi:MAG: hypothetical protein HFJ54_08045, partial [Clostridia bacterium]|nr:hypothetical protein [Clostridia bacterium]
YPKQSYNVNEAEDLTGGSILVTRATGTPEVIDLTDTEGRVAVTGFNSAADNPSLPITVTFTENGFSCNPTGYDITVKDSVTGIAIKTPPKSDQKYNEELDVTGGILTVTSGSGPRDIPITKDMVTGYDKTVLGEQELTITYGGFTKKYKVIVKDYVTGITVNPDTVTGQYNKELVDLISDEDIKYTVTYAKEGAKSPAQLLTSMVLGYSKTSKQTQNLKVKYTDNDNDSFTKGTVFETNFTVEANNPVTGVTIKAPDKVIYKHGEELDLAGGVITLTHIDNTTSTVPMTKAMITENGGTVNMSPSSYNSTNKVQKTLVITYTKDRRNRNSKLSYRDSKLCDKNTNARLSKTKL